MTLLKNGLLFAAIACSALAGQTSQSPTPEPLPKLLLDPNAPLILPYLKRCSDAVAITTVHGTEQFVLDVSTTNFRWSGKLYPPSKIGEEVVTFEPSFRTANFARQICDYFEALKTAQHQGSSNAPNGR